MTTAMDEYVSSQLIKLEKHLKEIDAKINELIEGHHKRNEVKHPSTCGSMELIKDSDGHVLGWDYIDAEREPDIGGHDE